ncbi:MAG: hypothetical protein QOF66_4954 [Mycobacterium sp.]|nr:hypothetical protein [Mycobacterium sp.]
MRHRKIREARRFWRCHRDRDSSNRDDEDLSSETSSSSSALGDAMLRMADEQLDSSVVGSINPFLLLFETHCSTMQLAPVNDRR